MDSKFKFLIMHISILILRANGSDVDAKIAFEARKRDCTVI
jgi:hypothetical protein